MPDRHSRVGQKYCQWKIKERTFLIIFPDEEQKRFLPSYPATPDPPVNPAAKQHQSCELRGIDFDGSCQTPAAILLRIVLISIICTICGKCQRRQTTGQYRREKHPCIFFLLSLKQRDRDAHEPSVANTSGSTAGQVCFEKKGRIGTACYLPSPYLSSMKCLAPLLFSTLE